MTSKRMWLGLVLEILLTFILAVRIVTQWDATLATFVAWLAIMSVNRMWFLVSKIDQIESRLGFGVSVPITEMPKVLEQIAGRIKPTQFEQPECEQPMPQIDITSAKPKRHKRNLLDELTDLENETRPLM